MKNVNACGLLVGCLLLGHQSVYAEVDPLDPVFGADRLADCHRHWRKPVVYDYLDQQGQKKTGGELSMPGFFDVGAGYFQIHNADGKGQDAHGLMMLAKAYPLRRHYSTIADAVLQPKVAQALDTVVKASMDAPAAPAAPAAKTDALQKLRDALKTVENEGKMVYSICYPDWQPSTALGKLVDPIMPERRLFSRIYTYLGVSLDESGSAKINDKVKAVGLGVDLTPEFSLNVGYAMYQVDVNGQSDSRESVVYGVSLNLAAFSVFREAVKLE